MNTLKNSFQNVVGAVVQLVIGILLLCKSDTFTKGIIIAFGFFLIFYALKNISEFFKVDAVDAYKQRYISKCLMSFIAGIICIIKAEWFMLIFPIQTLIYGIAILVYGIQKIDFMIVMRRLNHKVWIWIGINSLVSIICALVIITDPFRASRGMWIFSGLYLIVQAALDIVLSVIVEKRKK